MSVIGGKFHYTNSLGQACFAALVGGLSGMVGARGSEGKSLGRCY